MHDQRKREHLQICLNGEVRSASSRGLERYRLAHCALPEMALEEVDTATSFLGHPLQAPILVSAMTGGTALAHEINLRLATAAQQLGLAMGLGSQRAGVEDPALMATYQVREVAPDILLFANLGAVQLVRGYGPEQCRRAVESVGADALMLHLNPLQEALQAGGDTDFRGVLGAIERVCQALSVPVVVKEVGWGLSLEVARALVNVGVAALDVAGAGGTSWSEVERQRSSSASDAEVAEAFVSWGIRTCDSLVIVREACPDLPLIASGGVRNGVEAAICLALGAQLVGMAQALLQPAFDSAEAVTEKLAVVLRQLRTAMFCTGSRTVSDLNASRLCRLC